LIELDRRLYFIFIAIASSFLIVVAVTMTLGDSEKIQRQEELDRLIEARDQSLIDLEKAREDYYQAVQAFNNRESQPMKSILDELPTREKLEEMESIIELLPTREELEEMELIIEKLP